MKEIFFLLISVILVVNTAHSEPGVSYSQADRDRLVRVETKLEAFEKSVDNRFEGVNKKFDDVNKRFDRLEDKFDSYFMWGFGIVIMSIMGLIGFIIFDRRTTLAPVEQKNRQLIEILRELSKEDPKLKKLLDKAALL
jgi:hypothetical protein